ncbi:MULTISPECIES: ribonuclease III [Brucella/Ochrobactrum group]|uniref:ribonuclease III n=1 Tax=Brucella/Ochrobactrum group TaxID=2826938 RepID=UPI001655CE14|nr:MULTISPECIES: ribonuclease III [Brucella/Ochrobactrum group]MBC8717780.1 ribonuclease III [Ochrobactrum sp. Marseille-Q0166]
MASADKAALILEERTGHRFRNLKRLERALTHSSVQAPSRANYERLEFLGDRVLGLVVAEMLFEAFPDAPEGELSVRLNALVNAETCAAIADEIKLAELIHTGSDIKSLNDKRLLNVRADVVEALIATMYLDGGLEAARSFIKRYWQKRSLETGAARRDAKTELQEWAHQQGNVHPSYSILSRSGPDHDPLFTVEVKVEGFAPETGEGRSKRIAEQSAAEAMLYRESVWKRDTSG